MASFQHTLEGGRMDHTPINPSLEIEKGKTKKNKGVFYFVFHPNLLFANKIGHVLPGQRLNQMMDCLMPRDTPR